MPLNGFWQTVKTRIEAETVRHFPERQIYFRSHGTVRFLSISPKTQVGVITGAIGLSLWIGISSANMIFDNDVVETKDKQIASLKGAHYDLRTELQSLKSEMMNRAVTLEQRQQVIDALLDYYDAAPKAQIDLRQAPPSAAEVSAKPDVIIPRDKPDPASDGSSASPAASNPEGAALLPELHQLNSRLADLETEQEEALARLKDYARDEIQMMETALEVAGLSGEELLAAANDRPYAQGGPMTLEESDTLPDHSFDPTLNATAEELARLEELVDVFDRVPLLKPVTGDYYISSGFGSRRDPFRRSWSFHGGLDMAGHWNSPVMSTAAGTVTFSGRNGPYGRMVEVDHGNGFKTRYGHLARILVSPGEVIERGITLGLMGNSGRSTGTHLHYEIRFNDKVRNPLKFFKAAKHVQAEQQFE